MYKLPKLVVRPTSPKRHNQISLIKISRDGGVMKPGAHKRKSPSEDKTAAVVASTAPTAPKAPAVSEAAPAAPTSAPEVAGPSVPAVKAAAPPRPARVAPSPAPVANELAVQLRQLTEAEAASRGPQPGSDNDLQVPFFFKFRCGDACCPQPFAERPAMAREVGCTAGCVVLFHSGACSHGSAVSAAWAGPGMPCPTPDCGGKTLYAAEMRGAGVYKTFKYGEAAKADFEEAARQRKKRAAAEQERAAAKKAAKKAGMQARSGGGAAKKAPKPTTAAPATRPAVQAAAAVMPALAAAAAQAEREAREEKAAALVQRSDPVLVLHPRTPSPPAAPRAPRRSVLPPLPQAVRGRGSAAATVENAWLRRRPASTGTTAAEDDDGAQAVELAGRYATSCASAEADSGDSSGGEEASAMPSSPDNGAADPVAVVSNVEGWFALVDAFYAAEAAAKIWSPEPRAAPQPPAVSFAPLVQQSAPPPPLSYKGAIQTLAALRSAVVSPPPAPAAPPVLRMGAAPHKHALHKTEMCRWWKALGRCNHGEDCVFAHGDAELRAKPVFRCRYFDGPTGCYFGDECKYSHAVQGC